MAFPVFVPTMKSVQDAAGKMGSIAAIESDGQGTSPKQTADVEAALVIVVKDSIISPNEVDAIAPAIKGANDAGVPVVTVDPRVDRVAYGDMLDDDAVHVTRDWIGKVPDAVEQRFDALHRRPDSW